MSIALLLMSGWGAVHARIIEGENSPLDGVYSDSSTSSTSSGSACVETLRTVSDRALSIKENKQLTVVATTLKSILGDTHFPPKIQKFPKGGLVVEGSEATIKIFALSQNEYDFRLKFEIIFSQSTYESRYKSNSLWEVLTALDEILQPRADRRIGDPNWILKSQMKLKESPVTTPRSTRKPALIRWTAEYTFHPFQYPMTNDQLSDTAPIGPQERLAELPTDEDESERDSSKPRVRPIKKAFMAFITSILNLAKYDLSEN